MKYNVTIKGLTPYMQHRMDDIKLDEWEKQRGVIIERPEVSHEVAVRAEYHVYRNADGKCFIPSEHIRNSFINGGTFMKSKVGVRTKSMKSIVASTWMVSPEEILMPDYDAIDKRSTVNRNNKARVIVIRPKWLTWEASFQLDVLEPTITIETVKKLIEYSGLFIGIGSFRPTANGLFGKYELITIDKAKEAIKPYQK